MNGLSLRISSGSKNPKNTMSFPPLVLPDYKGARNESTEAFLEAATGEEQLAILKLLLGNEQDDMDSSTINFLVSVFFHSEAKHPIKGFLTRYITKNKHLHQPFIELLTTELCKQMESLNCRAMDFEEYKHFKEVIHKVSMCIENFTPGVQAVRNVDEQLAVFLTDCLRICRTTIQDGRDLSPTEKNDIYSLVHLTLRLLLHILTKHVDDQVKIKKLLERVTVYPTLYKLLQDKEMPMDAKSVCGIVLLSGCNINWKDVLQEKHKIMSDDHVQLAMFSAILTTMPMRELQEKLDGKPAIEILIENFMDIVERGSGDGILILGVSRAIHQISKGLSALEATAGRPAARRLLAFVWPHLDHYLDSVRHLANQSLALLVQYCAALDAADGGEELERVLDSMSALGVARGAFAALAGAARCVGTARLLRRQPLSALLPALPCTHVTNTAATTLTALLVLHSQETEAAVIHAEWVLPILQFIQTNDLDSDVLTVLEKLLARAVKLDENLLGYILPHITEACASPNSDLRHVLALASAVRASRGDSRGLDSTDDLWRGIIPYAILEEAIVDANDEVRIQCLSLLSCGGRATAREAALVLRYLQHCACAQAPHTRQRAIALMKKFLKRVLDGHRAATKSGDDVLVQMYEDFVQQLTDICVAGLAQCANYSRRCTALQLLHATAHSALHSPWQPRYVDKLLQRLDDSYETNKALALEILLLVPVEMLQDADNSTSLRLADVISQANALAPTECMSAAYKLELVWRRLPENALQGQACATSVEPTLYKILWELHDKLSKNVESVHDFKGYNALLAPRDRPRYGLLYCMAHLIDRMDVQAIGDDLAWSQLFELILMKCNDCINDTKSVVNNVSPEGVMPANCQYTDYGNDAGVRLEDGRQVTAQMVLLCAWRTVKEATGVMGATGARLPVREQWGGGPLEPEQLIGIATRLGSVVSEARHRGAFEQAYVAYERLLYRMWREPNSSVRSWMKARLQHTMAWLQQGAAWKHGASRRSAGLPFLIQALVSTEMDCGGAGSALGPVMRALLAAAAPTDSGARAHVYNMLRALYRDSSLHAAVQSYVGEGLQLAIKGFEGASWEERNSSTLLLSALIQRVFGVSRARASLTARDKMTGRVFFLRYPGLYDIMLDKLKEVSASESTKLLCPSLYPVLLLLARLYPSSLEGTESNIKLVSFVPHVVACARSPVLKTRRLAAAAAVSLIPPDRYVSHLCYLLRLISEATVERNFCHGILLQICALLDNKPSDVDCLGLAPSLLPTAWILAQAPGSACYPILHQYVRLLTALLDTFPETLPTEFLANTELKLEGILFAPAAGVAPGRQLCLSDCLSLALALHERKGSDHVTDLIIRGLNHEVQEVCGAALDYVLRLYARGACAGGDCARGACAGGAGAREGSSGKILGAEAVLAKLRSRPQFLEAVRRRARAEDNWLCDPQHNTKILEVLVLEDCIEDITSSAAITRKFLTDGEPDVDSRYGQIHRLCLLASRDEARLHLYLEALTRCLSKLCDEYIKMPNQRPDGCVSSAEQDRISLHHFCAGVQHVVLPGCDPGESIESREVAARYLSSQQQRLLDTADNLPHIYLTQHMDSQSLGELMYKIQIYPLLGISWLLRDEEASIRAIAADALRPQSGRSVVPSLAAHTLRTRCGRGARGVRRLCTLALSYPGVRCYGDGNTDDECRIFDESEKFNVYSEDELWTITCADKVIELCAEEGVDPVARVNDLLSQNQTEVLSCPHPEAAKELFLKRLRGEVM